MTVLSDHTIELSDLTFHYREAGNPGAPPLILLHQLLADAQDWDEIALTLAEHYHIFALDQRGHGGSARPGIYSFELMRDDLKAFADALLLDRFTLIGHSMGGTVAFLFAESWPERIERLVIEDTPPPHGKSALSDIPEEPPETVPPHWQSNWQLVKSIVRQLRNPDPSWWRDLPTITAPTLIIGGGSTSDIPQEQLAEVAHLIPDCRLVTIEGAGHTVHQNRPEEYKALLRNFLFG
ncbi:alpha/beta hydrolase [Ktedonobacteria bacterium brp13]|nr:alpha/beta hydrolase [Ktedonobacteria bacterium brp13]